MDKYISLFLTTAQQNKINDRYQKKIKRRRQMTVFIQNTLSEMIEEFIFHFIKFTKLYCKKLIK